MVDVQPFTSGEVLSHVGHLAAGMTPSVLSYIGTVYTWPLHAFS